MVTPTSYYTKLPFSQTFYTGNCKGYVYSDNFNFINNINFGLKFGVADETTFGTNKADGIIGLSHYYEDEDYSLIHILKKNQIIDSISFSFKFKEDI